MRRVPILAAIIVLTACAAPPPPPFWEKEGVSPQAADIDLVECRRTAHLEALSENSDFGFGGFSRFGPYYGYRRLHGSSRHHHPPFFRRGPFVRRGLFFWGGPYYGSPYYGAPSAFDREIQLTAFCMRAKGYGLVAAPPVPTAPKDN